MLSEIRKNGELAFYQKEWQVVGLLYRYGDHEYILTAAALDQYGYNKLNSLLRNNILVFIISIVFVFLAGRYFSRKAFEPIMEMTEKAKVISATNLDLRLSTTDTGDELAELANTFNQMLERLEKSFDAQKAFVSNISHELRTPLTALIAELELALVSTGISESTRLSLQNSLLDAKKLVRLTNSLLDLAKASYDPAEISFKNVRIDEVLLDAMHQLQQTNPEYRIDLYFEPNISEDETEYTGHPAIDAITIKANEYLLKSAFINLMENGCKFSDDHRCTVSIGLSDHKTATAVHNTHNKSDGENRKPIVVVTIRDQGIGISESDLENIFNPFFRGKNKNYTEGNGIGLSLSQKIIQLHQGKMHVASELHKGTIITLHFPCSPVAD
jgi:signal transduction histidine kinase